MDVICFLVIIGGRYFLQFKDCINEVLKFYVCDVIVMLLICYVVKYNKNKLLKYLVSVEVDEEMEREVFVELLNDLVLIRDVLFRMRYLYFYDYVDF